jgi:phosphoglycolate phosphatase-like HAD superfamily hydrolase
MNSLLSDDYRTLVFDCDGVILNSNRVKTEAFRTAAMPYGILAAQELVDYHIANGGVSRYVKFRYFLDTIVPKFPLVNIDGSVRPSLDSLLTAYSQSVRNGLMTCMVAEGLDELRKATVGTRWLIVSGGDQSELREIFAARSISRHFDGGIMGSPETKDSILSREIERGNIKRPALFLGDSRYDFHAAKAAGLDFIFISGWTEMKDWPNFVNDHNLRNIGHLAELANAVE